MGRYILYLSLLVLLFSSCTSLKTLEKKNKIDTVFVDKVIIKDSIIRVPITDNELMQEELNYLYTTIDDISRENSFIQEKLSICESSKTKIKYKNIRNSDMSSTSVIAGRLNDLQILNSKQQEEIKKLNSVIKDKSKEKPTEKIITKECKKTSGIKDYLIWFGILCIGVLIGRISKKV